VCGDILMKDQYTIIKPSSGWEIVNIAELKEYRDMFYFLVWRDIKARYAQSVLGIGWAIIQPVVSMIVYTIIFGTLVKVDSDGAPYAIFSYVALVPWTFFAGSITASTSSLTGMITKIYFPRLILPLASILSKGVDFCISFVILGGLLFYYQVKPTVWIFSLPLLVIVLMLTAVGIGLWLSALSVQYRDVRYGLSFGVQLLMYAAPVVYPASLIPDQYRLFYAINPMVGVIEGFRSALLATNPMPWDLISIGLISTMIIVLSGALYFKRREKFFADVI
jgi:lipopolysaccharide transport system permease protein